MIEQLNSLSDLWWGWLSLAVISVIPLYIFAELIMRYGKKLSADIKYIILLVVLFNCITVPMLSVPLPFVVVSDSPNNEVINVSTNQTVPIETNESESIPANNTATLVADEMVKFSLSWKLALFMLSITGSVVLISLIAAKRWQVSSYVKYSRRNSDLEHLCSSLAKRLNCKPPRLYVIDKPIPPFVIGIFNRKILLPASILSKPTDQQELILAHELAHFNRFDPLVNCFQLAITIICWWNPIVTRLNHLIRCERELCCDQLVLRLLQVEPVRYSNMLLDVAEEQLQHSIPISGTAFFQPKHNITERIRRINMFNKLKKRYSLSGMIIISVFLSFTLIAFGEAKEGRAVKVDENFNSRLNVNDQLVLIKSILSSFENQKLLDNERISEERLQALRKEMSNVLNSLVLTQKIALGIVKDEADLINKKNEIKEKISLAEQNGNDTKVKELKRELNNLILPDNLRTLPDELIFSPEGVTPSQIKDYLEITKNKMQKLKSEWQEYYSKQGSLPLTENYFKKNPTLQYTFHYQKDSEPIFYCYYVYDNRFIILSPGPDGDIDFDVTQYKGQSLEELSEYIYDESKGLDSDGDIIVIGP